MTLLRSYLQGAIFECSQLCGVFIVRAVDVGVIQEMGQLIHLQKHQLKMQQKWVTSLAKEILHNYWAISTR
jgi:hypothetical protein